jgi:hypothetical protein
MALAVTACGGDDSTTPTTQAPATSGSTTTMPAAALDPMLLQPDDIGAAWTLGHAIQPEDLSTFAQLACENSALNPTIVTRLTARTGVQFDAADRSDAHLIELLVTGEPGRLSADLDVLAEAVQAPCADTGAAPPDGAGVTVEELSIPGLGDQRHAWAARASEPAGGPTWFVRTAVVRVGSVAVELRLTEILASPQAPPRIGDSEFNQLLETAVGALTA